MEILNRMGTQEPEISSPTELPPYVSKRGAGHPSIWLGAIYTLLRPYNSQRSFSPWFARQARLWSPHTSSCYKGTALTTSVSPIPISKV